MAVTINGTDGIETNTDTGKVKVGADDDLHIYHDGSNNLIAGRNATADLKIQTNDNTIFQKVDSSGSNAETLAQFFSDGACELFYDNSKKFETISGGVSVTGELTVTTNLVGIDSSKLKLGNSSDLEIFHDASDSYISNTTDTDLIIRNLGNAGIDIKPQNSYPVNLYYNNNKRFSTWSDACIIFGDEGESARLYLYCDEGDNNGDKWVVKIDNGEQAFMIQNYASGSWETNLRCDGNAGVQLYYDDSVKFDTHSEGVTVSGDCLPSADNHANCLLGKSSKRWNTVYAGTGTINTSDKNEKNTIVETDLGLSFVNKLKPVSYKFNSGTRTHYGLIAQDIETTLSDISKPTTGFAGFIKEDIPNQLYVERDEIPEGKKVGDVKKAAYTTYGLRYAEFISPLIKAVQELSAEVDTLKTEKTKLQTDLTALTARVAALEAK